MTDAPARLEMVTRRFEAALVGRSQDRKRLPQLKIAQQRFALARVFDADLPLQPRLPGLQAVPYLNPPICLAQVRHQPPAVFSFPAGNAFTLPMQADGLSVREGEHLIIAARRLRAPVDG